MKEDNYRFGEKITLDLKVRQAAYKILDVREDATEGMLKKAYRRASIRYHPDHNPNNADAHKKFLIVKCAYELLTKDRPCEMLLEEIKSWSGVPEDSEYELDNLWGHFLWWREKFFI